MQKLYRFFWDCGRQGDVEGMFVATPEEVAAVIGKQVYFGEILGKHSEIHGEPEEKDFTIISEDQEKIAWLVDTIGDKTICGYNPLSVDE